MGAIFGDDDAQVLGSTKARPFVSRTTSYALDRLPNDLVSFVRSFDRSSSLVVERYRIVRSIVRVASFVRSFVRSFDPSSSFAVVRRRTISH
eukprot:4343731-Pyramimonas_sp.AAC.1